MNLVKLLLKPSIMQPVLSLVLVGLLVVLMLQFFNSRGTTKENTFRQLSQRVTFDDAVKLYTDKQYQVYTQGSLIVKDSSLEKSPESINPEKVIPSVTGKESKAT